MQHLALTFKRGLGQLQDVTNECNLVLGYAEKMVMLCTGQHPRSQANDSPEFLEKAGLQEGAE